MLYYHAIRRANGSAAKEGARSVARSNCHLLPFVAMWTDMRRSVGLAVALQFVDDYDMAQPWPLSDETSLPLHLDRTHAATRAVTAAVQQGMRGVGQRALKRAKSRAAAAAAAAADEGQSRAHAVCVQQVCALLAHSWRLDSQTTS